MFKLTHNTPNGPKTAEFDDYRDLVLYVATNMIMDQDFVSLTLGDETFDSLSEFAAYVATGIKRQKEIEAEMAEREEEDSEEDYEEYFEG